MKNIIFLALFLVPTCLFSIYFGENFCRQPHRHCVGEEQAQRLSQWWSSFKTNHAHWLWVTELPEEQNNESNSAHVSSSSLKIEQGIQFNIQEV